jgi:hypothetical protein
MSVADVRAAVRKRFGDGDASARPEPDRNEFVIFSKPELGRLSPELLGVVWDLLAGALKDYAVTVHTIKILTGPELERSGAMQRHYGVINQISRLGRPALTEAAASMLVERYPDLETSTVLGGHQFLQRYPEISPYALAMLFANAEVNRLGPGTYAATVRMDGEPVVILNGFHPRQLSFFTAEDTACAFLHGSSATDWEALRSDLIGATDPAQAKPSSLRGTLYADPGQYGLASVSSNFNGVHMSAGPLEGLGELDRFFGDIRPLSEWAFARALAAAGAGGGEIDGYLENPVLEADGRHGTAFDLTEGRNAPEAAALLAGSRTVSEAS